MSKLAFTLLELIIVVIIIGIVSFLVIKFPKNNSLSSLTPFGLRNYFYPTGKLVVFEDGINITDKNKSVNLKLTLPVVYVYEDNEWKIKNFNKFNNKEVVFEYEIKNGVQKPFILKCDEGIYVFKPLFVYKVSSLQEAKDLYFNKQYALEKGKIY
jgi:prepilin-type N-terminal cleavage/methylation domain-containing protein